MALDNYDEYEKECKRIRQDNIQLLDEFDAWLREKQLTEDTIRKHVFNIDFYINHFLLYEEAIEAKNGASEIGLFLGDWFIRKALWSSVNHIKDNAASLKKFYVFMCEKGKTEQEDLEDLNADIKEEMPEWIAEMKRFNDLAEGWDL